MPYLMNMSAGISPKLGGCSPVMRRFEGGSPDVLGGLEGEGDIECVVDGDMVGWY